MHVGAQVTAPAQLPILLHDDTLAWDGDTLSYLNNLVTVALPHDRDAQRGFYWAACMYRHHNPTPDPETVLEWIAQGFADRDNAPGTLEEWLRDLMWDDGHAMHAWLLDRAELAGYHEVHIRTGATHSATAIIPAALLTPRDPRLSN